MNGGETINAQLSIVLHHVVDFLLLSFERCYMVVLIMLPATTSTLDVLDVYRVPAGVPKECLKLQKSVRGIQLCCNTHLLELLIFAN
jgi:hypothetical protein